jgi:hypothetical protein
MIGTPLQHEVFWFGPAGRTESSELGWDYPFPQVSHDTKFVGQAGANLSFVGRAEAPLLQGTLRNRPYHSKTCAPTSEAADQRRDMPPGHAPGGISSHRCSTRTGSGY